LTEFAEIVSPCNRGGSGIVAAGELTKSVCVPKFFTPSGKFREPKSVNKKGPVRGGVVTLELNHACIKKS
jgi:hypothetical protein